MNAETQKPSVVSLPDGTSEEMAEFGIETDKESRPNKGRAGDKVLAHLETSLASYPLHPGFPVEVDNGQIVRSATTIADLDNDGNNELLVGTYNGKVYGWNASGSPLPGYPFTTGGRITGHLALGDLDQDGDLEIVAGVGSVENGAEGRVFVWQHNGALFSGWPQNVDQFDKNDEAEVNTVVLADIDGDLDLEIVAGTDNNIVGTGASSDTDVPDLYVWHHTGALAAGNWPAKDGPAIKFGRIVAGDLNADGQTDILVGRDYHWLFAYDHLGNNIPGWPLRTFVAQDGSDTNKDPRIVHKMTSPVLADLDRDGKFEYIAPGLRKLPGSSDAVNPDLLVLQADGTRRPGWETPAAGAGVLVKDEDSMERAPAIADLNGDTKLDIVLPTSDGWIRAYTADKTLLWQFNYAQGKIIYSSEPVIGDVDNDGLYEVIFGTYDPSSGTVGPVGVWILEHDGSVKAGSPLAVAAPGILGAPSLADLDGDGLIEIAAAARRGEVYVWDTPSPFDPVRLPWPVARQNLRRTAVFNAKELSAVKSTNVPVANQGETITYTILLVRTGPPLTHTIQITDVIPNGVSYVPDTVSATHGVPDDTLAPMLRWTGVLSEENLVTMTYQVLVTEESPLLVVNSAIIHTGTGGPITRRAAVIINPIPVYLPAIYKAP